MAITAYAQLRVTAPVVGDDGSAGFNGPLDEATQRFGTSVWLHRKPNTSGVPSSPPLVEAATGLALFKLDGTGDKCHVVPASGLAASAAAAVGFIGRDVLSVVTVNPIAPAGNVPHDDGNNNNITPNLEHTQIVPGDETTPAVPPGGWRTRLALVWRSIF